MNVVTVLPRELRVWSSRVQMPTETLKRPERTRVGLPRKPLHRLINDIVVRWQLATPPAVCCGFFLGLKQSNALIALAVRSLWSLPESWLGSELVANPPCLLLS
jgi:hypothetical protein